MVIKTNALIYDDRFRKEVQSLQRLGIQVTASVIEDANEARDVHDYGDGFSYDFRVYSLFIKQFLKQRLFVLLHLFEFILRTCVQIVRIRPQAVWIHDPIMMVMIPFLVLLKAFGFTKKIIWDHHELPVRRIDESSWLRRVFAWFCRRADVIIGANQERLDYLKENYPGFAKGKEVVIRNYSDSEFIQQPCKSLPEELVSWLNGRDYFLVQSGVVELRNFKALAEAVISDDTLPPIVAVGGGNNALIEEMKQRFKEQFEQRVYLIGKVPQMELTRFLDGAVASIILYQKSYGINNWLCEPNRLFQAMNRNIPVIVGNNPPMAEMIERLGGGLVLADDGVTPGNINQTLHYLVQNRANMPKISDDNLENLSWEAQDSVIADLVH